MAFPTAIPHQGTPGRWNDLTSAGGPATQDAAIVNDVLTQVTVANGRKVIEIPEGMADYAVVSMLYDGTLTGITDPIVGLAGASYDAGSGVGDYEVLNNRNNARTASLACAPSSDQVGAGGLVRTAIDNAAHIFPLKGCRRIVPFVETALAGSTGSTATAKLQIKFARKEEIE